MTAPLPERLATLAHDHGGTVDDLLAAIERSQRVLAALRTAFAAAFADDPLNASVVVGGSVARGHCIAGSDIDFFTMADGDVLPAATSAKIVRVVMEAADGLGMRGPHPEGPAASSVARAEVETIQPYKDDRGKFMRRTALVTTSTWIYGEKLHAEVLARLIDAFVGGDRTPHVRSFVDHIMRLARVMNLTSDWVIDTKSKRGEGLVSWAKVRTLHRIELASCLAAAFRTEHACAGRGRGAVVDELFRQMSRSPYERLLDLYEELDDHERTWVATIVYSANTALRIIGGEGAREKLVANQGDPETEQLRRELVPIVEQLDEALFQLFFKSKLLGSLTERLALFG